MLWLLGCLAWFQTSDAMWRQWIESRLQRNSALVLHVTENPAVLSPLALQEYLLTLGQNGDPSALEQISAFLDHGRIQGSAIFAYGEVDGAPLGPLLALESRVQSLNLVLYTEALSKLAGPEHGETLFQVWKRLSLADRNRALFFFWRNKPEAVTKAVFAKLRNDPKPEDIGYAYYLYRSRTPAEADLIAGLIPQFRDHAQALIYLTRITPSARNQNLEKRLARLCRAGDWRVRVNALNALGDTQWKRSRAMALLADPNPNVVRTALTVLVGLGQAELDHNLAVAPRTFTPCQIQALIDAANSQQVARFLPLTRSWLDSGDSWRHRKALTSLGKVFNENGVTRLEAEIARGLGGEAAIALGALIQLPGRVDAELLEGVFASGDPYLMAGGLDPVADGEVAFSRETLAGLVKKRYREPDFHYRYLDRIEELAPPGKASAMLVSLRDHDQYLVRLKAIAVSPAASLEMRRRIFQKPWRSGVPEEVAALAAQMIKGGAERVWTLRTSKGAVAIRLEGAYAPITSANILYLARKRFFDRMPIHRVVPNFVVQAGDPRGDGSGGPGYAIPCEINTLRYRRGTVGMALAGKDTGGSQFFICHSDQPHLDGGYTVFGQVTRGMEVVDRLEEGDLILSTDVQ